MNKKIKNATALTYDNIQFKSKTEVMVYKTLLQLGFDPYYEATKYRIWEGFVPTVPYYTKGKDKNLKRSTKKLIDITYTPDFVFLAPDKKTVVIIEVKGFANDVFPIKRKMFRKYLETIKNELKQPVVYFEIYTKKQLMQAIEIIKSNYGSGKSKGETEVSQS